MGPGSEGEKDFKVEEPDPALYNPTGADPPVWQPDPQDILQMFEQLENEQVLPLKWACSGRRPPEKEAPELPVDNASDGGNGDNDKEEEKRAPEPSAFDFDDTASEASAKVKMTPRTPVSAQAKRPEKKVARMDNVLNSLKRQQKAEREARKSHGRGLGTAGFHGGSSTPLRPTSFSPTTSPRLPTSATVSPGPSSPRGSPRIPAPAAGSPLSSRPGGSGESATPKPESLPESPTNSAPGGGGATESSPPAQSSGEATMSTTSPPKPSVSDSPATTTTKTAAATTAADVVTPAPVVSASTANPVEDSVTMKVEGGSSEVSADPEPMETDTDPPLPDAVTVKQEG